MYTAMSLFSGMGGDCLGMTLAKCNVLAYNEKEATFCETHDANFPSCELIQDGKVRDITKVRDVHFENYRDKIDILFAGFPCQGFSNAGKKNDNDPRNTLFREFVRVTTIIQPKMIIGENVKGLLSRKTSSNELYIDVIVKEFEALGYEVQYKVLKTESYNVPQTRERMILIGTKRENPYGWKPCFPDPSSTIPNLRNIVKYNMTGALKIPEEWIEDIPETCILTDMTDQNKYQENEKAHPYLVGKKNASEEERTYSDKTFSNLFSFSKRISPIHCEIIDIRNPAKTIICSYEHQPRLFVPLKNSSGCYLRMLLPTELKQIQGFPIDYKLCGNQKEQIIQIGNAVPPPLIKAVIEHIINCKHP